MKFSTTQPADRAKYLAIHWLTTLWIVATAFMPEDLVQLVGAVGLGLSVGVSMYLVRTSPYKIWARVLLVVYTLLVAWWIIALSAYHIMRWRGRVG